MVHRESGALQAVVVVKRCAQQHLSAGGVDEHTQPFSLDSKDPSIPVSEFTAAEGRFAILARSEPERAAELMALAQIDVDERWRYYRQLAGVERTLPQLSTPGAS